MKLNIFSDLRKPGLVPGESLSLAQNYVFCFGETLIYIMSNRMRNLHIQHVIVDCQNIFIIVVVYHIMSTIMELSERLIQVRSTAKHEKDYPSFTQDDIVFLFGDVVRPVGQVLNNSDPLECFVIFPSAAPMQDIINLPEYVHV